MLKHLAFALPLLAAGCAQAPADIMPTYVSPTTYQGFTCAQMNSEANAINTALNSLLGAQQTASENDAALTAATLILFWPAAFFVTGGTDNADEIANLRGQSIALADAARQRGCD